MNAQSTDTPVISVIIPTFNYAGFLPRAIDSALGQDYPRVEVVVIDDGSTDSTPEVAASYGKRIVFKRQENRGLAGARNTGIRASSGEFLFFLDADDVARPHTLSRLASILLSEGPECGMIACQPNLIEIRNGVEHPVSLPELEQEGQLLPVAWARLAVSTHFPCTVLARKLVFDRCGLFDESYRHLGCEDRDMWLRIAANYRILHLQERLVVLRFHDANMSSNPQRQLAGIRKLNGKTYRMGVMPRWRLDFWGALWSTYHYSASVLNEGAGHPGRAWLHSMLSLIVYPLPGVRSWIRRPRWFRVARFAACSRSLLKQRSTAGEA